jgi:hypothetical protein
MPGAYTSKKIFRFDPVAFYLGSLSDNNTFQRVAYYLLFALTIFVPSMVHHHILATGCKASETCSKETENLYRTRTLLSMLAIPVPIILYFSGLVILRGVIGVVYKLNQDISLNNIIDDQLKACVSKEDCLSVLDPNRKIAITNSNNEVVRIYKLSEFAHSVGAWRISSVVNYFNEIQRARHALKLVVGKRDDKTTDEDIVKLQALGANQFILRNTKYLILPSDVFRHILTFVDINSLGIEFPNALSRIDYMQSDLGAERLKANHDRTIAKWAGVLWSEKAKFAAKRQPKVQLPANGTLTRTNSSRRKVVS